jgi:UDP-N-acetylmuramoyl-tripeptide--D-alanyl-D-alanine ligase
LKALWKKEELLTATKGLDPSSDFLKKMEGAFGVCIDDRTIKKGDLFIAIKGENFDGHDFIESAVSKGASGVIVSDKQHALEYKGLLVKDTKIALKNIAYFSRNRFFGKVIAITGSSGKTSTKHILSTSLQSLAKLILLKVTITT